jgi:hypothetical protein
MRTIPIVSVVGGAPGFPATVGLLVVTAHTSRTNAIGIATLGSHRTHGGPSHIGR